MKTIVTLNDRTIFNMQSIGNLLGNKKDIRRDTSMRLCSFWQVFLADFVLLEVLIIKLVQRLVSVALMATQAPT